MREETWRPVLGYEQLYEVSNCGRVRATYSGNHGAYKPFRILKQDAHKNEYLFVTLYRPSLMPESGRGTPHKGKARSVHSLVLEAFKGLRKTGQVSRHLDGNRIHNTPENLEWGTVSENCDDAKRHGTFVIGSKNGFSKLTEADIPIIRAERDRGVPCKTIADRFGLNWSTIWLIGARKTWKHVP